MNIYYINVAKDGSKILILRNTLTLLKTQHSEGNNFQFHHATREDLLKILKTLNPEKAAGFDLIPAKLLKHAFLQIAPVIST